MKITFTFRLFFFFLCLSTFLLEVQNATAQCSGGQTTVTFSAMASVQTWVVPAGITSVDIIVTGADGGNHYPASNGGSGATASAIFAVTPGETLQIVAGEAGASDGNSSGGSGGGGGGGSGVRRAAGSVILMVAGGGGGGGYNTTGGGGTTTAGAGNGGGAGSHPGNGAMSETGSSGAGGGGVNSAGAIQNGGNNNAGAGGSSGFGVAGGSGSNSNNSSADGGFGVGGGGAAGADDGNDTEGGAGGGGGGYSGGAGGDALGNGNGTEGGEGGSSYVDPIATFSSFTAGTAGGSAGGGGSVTICFGFLPVELVYFRAQQYEAREVGLSWYTASEINNAGFMLEHSTTGDNWTELDFVPGKGTTSAAQSYSYMHQAPSSGINYYRLKQIDLDGSFEYSDIVSAEIGGNTNGMFFSPNPADADASVILHLLMENFEEGRLEVFDINGKVILSKDIDKTSLPFEITRLSKGIYYTVITYGQNRLVEPLVVN